VKQPLLLPQGCHGFLQLQGMWDTPQNGTIGEIRVTGQGLMLGYLNRPKETAERLRNGYLYTGDLGYKKKQNS